MGYEKEKKSVSSQEREMLFCAQKFGKELHGLADRGISVDVEHVKAHRTKKEKKTSRSLRGLSQKAMRRLMSWQEQERCAALQYAASFHCLVEQLKDCEEFKPRPKEVNFR